MLWSAFTRHFWLAPPVQVVLCTMPPAARLLPRTSRHRRPSKARSSAAAVRAHAWFACPLQSQMTTRVLIVLVFPETSRQRPEATPTTGVPVAACAGTAPVSPKAVTARTRRAPRRAVRRGDGRAGLRMICSSENAANRDKLN
jgi:hypothetical protein